MGPRGQPRLLAMAALGLCVGLVVKTVLRPPEDDRGDATSQRPLARPETLAGARPASSESGFRRQLACTDSSIISSPGGDADAADPGRTSARRRAEVRALVTHVKNMR